MAIQMQAQPSFMRAVMIRVVSGVVTILVLWIIAACFGIDII